MGLLINETFRWWCLTNKISQLKKFDSDKIKIYKNLMHNKS